MNLRNRDKQHLFMEDTKVESNSFIANVNLAAKNVKNIATFNEIMSNAEAKDVVDAIISQVEGTLNKWEIVLQDMAQQLMTAASAFNFCVTITADRDVPSGAEFTLPNILLYTVGSNMLMVSYNGTVCYNGQQYSEVGTKGEPSNKILINFPIVSGDTLNFRVIALAKDDILDAIVDKIDQVLSTDIPVFTDSTDVPRYLTDRFADVLNVKDFGATGNGITNDSSAFNAAITRGQELSSNVCLFIPTGKYLVNTLPNVPCYGPGTIICDNKEYSPFELLFSINGSIIKDDNGRFKVDFSQLPPAEVTNIINNILPDVAEDGALTTDEDGKLIIDFDQLSDTKLQELVNQLISQTGGLESDSGGLRINTCATGGLVVTNDGCLSLKTVANGGIKVNSSGVSVDEEWLMTKVAVTSINIDEGDGISITTGENNAIVISALASTGITVSPAGIAVNESWLDGKISAAQFGDLSAGNGIQIDQGSVSVKAGTGITVDSNGVNVNETWLAEKIGSGDGTAYTAGNGISLADNAITVKPHTGITVDTNGVSVNTTWLDTQIEDKVGTSVDSSFYLPLFTTITSGEATEVHTVLPSSVTTVKYTSIEANGSGTSGLTITMKRDIGSETSMTVTDTASNCADYAGYAVTFIISGATDQTECAAMIVFD